MEKLVRDKIPAIAIAGGAPFPYRIAAAVEHEDLLRQKLFEETNEFFDSGDMMELADMLEVMYALAAQKGVSPAGLELLRQQKRATRGGFDDYIVWTNAPESVA